MQVMNSVGNIIQPWVYVNMANHHVHPEQCFNKLQNFRIRSEIRICAKLYKYICLYTVKANNQSICKSEPTVNVATKQLLDSCVFHRFYFLQVEDMQTLLQRLAKSPGTLAEVQPVFLATFIFVDVTQPSKWCFRIGESSPKVAFFHLKFWKFRG